MTEMDAVNAQHMAARGLDASQLGKAVAKRWSEKPIPKGEDGQVAHVPTVVLRCGHDFPYDPARNTPPQKGDVLLCSECGVGQEVVLVPKVREGDQHLPTQNDEPDIQSLVIADIEQRRQVGIERYGTALQPFNGRKTMRDLYEELVDSTVYARAMLEMQDASFERLVEVVTDVLVKEEPGLGEHAGAIAEVIVYALRDALVH